MSHTVVARALLFAAGGLVAAAVFAQARGSRWRRLLVGRYSLNPLPNLNRQRGQRKGKRSLRSRPASATRWPRPKRRAVSKRSGRSSG